MRAHQGVGVPASEPPVAGPDGNADRAAMLPPETPSAVWEAEEERVSQPGEAWPQDPGEALESAGKHLEAIRAYREAGHHDKAARLARRLGRNEQAARYYASAGKPYQAAACFIRAKRADESLEQLVRVRVDSPHYRSACVHAIRLCHRADTLSRSVMAFLEPFVAEPPVDERERKAVFLLGEVLEGRAMVASARRIYRVMRRSAPDRPLADARLHQLDQRAARVPHAEAGQSDQPPPVEKPSRRVPPPGPEPASAPVGPGDLLASRYRIEKLLGAGGMAAVFEAVDLELEERVALKLFRPLSGDQRLVQRFKRELAVTRKLTHPHIVRVHDIGSCDHGPFMTMEMLEGKPLSAVVAEGPVDVRTGVRMLAQACDGLAAVHAAGVVHRDIKPENLFLTTANVVKVMDFGIAKQQRQPTLTTAGFLAGSPAYMAPEQIRDFRAVTYAADIYALGVVAYELFTGRLPFTDTEVVPLLMKHCTEPVPSPRRFNASLPQRLERLILATLEKSPEERVAGCTALRDDLVAIASDDTA